MFRENMAQYVTEGQTVYVPKNGGLNDYIMEMLPTIGIDPKTGVVSMDGKDVSAVKLVEIRGEDIPKWVAEDPRRGARSIGLTGDDLYDEFRLRNPDAALRMLNTYDWFDPEAQFYRPALCLMNSSGELEAFADQPVIAINSKYTETSRQGLTAVLGAGTYSVSAYNGDTELVVSEGIAQGAVEIVYRGTRSEKSALSKTGLKIVGSPFRFSDISLIAADPSRGT